LVTLYHDISPYYHSFYCTADQEASFKNNKLKLAWFLPYLFQVKQILEYSRRDLIWSMWNWLDRWMVVVCYWSISCE